MPEEIKQEIKPITPISIIDRAEAVNKLLEENIRKQEELIRKNEELLTKQLLGGRTEAGITNKIDPEQEKKERLKNYWKGSAIEKAFK